jgi:nitroreductase
METYDALMTRRSVPKLTDRAPDRATVQRLIDAGTRAPSHHLTQPWRFVVLAGDARKELAEAWIRGAENQGKDTKGLAEKPLRAPVIICVIETPHLENPKVVEIEEHYAVGAAMQNILLAAHDTGLGAMLRTGPIVSMPEVKEFLEVGEGEMIAGFIYVGYAPENDGERPLGRRTPAEQLTKWRGW